ncbi:hypothetical protein R6L23_09595 [Streptomyces sp. SR27]|uniref:hypothetical protein n=1 Tax=Streptomyces sp. SR27 TaxID=3076630 RepID=UPI00295B271E|nr:hypothetical protein [Streptomyces sp. SR27]MDV9188464.1 hypothetical protein [Streptomyces sp. SR27]
MTTPTNPLTRQTVQRLAFIRFLHEQGVAQSRQPQPLAATSVLSFHDAVELFLVLAGEHLQVGLPTQINFSQYWEKLAAGLPSNTQLPSKKAMERMNKLRVNLKHHGAVPSPTDIDQVRADVQTFFTDATPIVFGGLFTQIDMIDLVTRQQTVEFLKFAQICADRGDLPQAMAALSIAFRKMLDHYTETRRSAYRPPFRFGDFRDFRDESRKISGDREARKLRLNDLLGYVKEISRQLSSLTAATKEIQRAMRVTALGIDYTRYAQFEVLTPQVGLYAAGSARFVVEEGHKLLTVEDYQFARMFVIESAMQAAKADAVLQRRLDHRTASNPSPGVWNRGEQRDWEGPDPFGS